MARKKAAAKEPRPANTLQDKLSRIGIAREQDHRVRPGEEARTEGFFDARGEIGMDAMTGRRAGVYLSRYARSHGLEIADALVAAAASTAGLHLWTLNVWHYPMDDLRLYRP